MGEVRVLLADDQPLIRAGLRVLLETEDGYAVAAEAADGAQAVRAARRTRPDVVLMDVPMPGTDGLDALAEITGDPGLAGARVIVLTTFDLDGYVYRALRSGASGFLLKDTDPVSLLRAIDLVHSGEALLAPSVTRRLITEFARHGPAAPPARDRLAVLTGREREVLARPRRARPHQRRDRRRAGDQPGHRAHPRGPAADQLDAQDRAGARR